MSKKNLFLLAAWYVAGWIISSLYNSKKPEELKKTLKEAKEKWDGSFKILVDTFIETHTNLIDDLREELLSEKNKKLLTDHKDDILNIIDSYKEKWNLLIEELKINGKSYLYETTEKLDLLYREKILELDELKSIAPDKMELLKDKLLLSFEELKKEIKNVKTKK